MDGINLADRVERQDEPDRSNEVSKTTATPGNAKNTAGPRRPAPPVWQSSIRIRRFPSSPSTPQLNAAGNATTKDETAGAQTAEGRGQPSRRRSSSEPQRMLQRPDVGVSRASHMSGVAEETPREAASAAGPYCKLDDHARIVVPNPAGGRDIVVPAALAKEYGSNIVDWLDLVGRWFPAAWRLQQWTGLTGM